MARWRRRLGIAVVGGVLGLLASSPLWLRPDSAPPEFETHAPTEATLDSPKIAEGPVTVRVVTAQGAPAGETTLIVDHPDWDSRHWLDTDEDGILRLDVPLGSILRPAARSTPERATSTCSRGPWSTARSWTPRPASPSRA
ncbi:MAG: hypothetical protein GY913_05540 [Proteobacteria bacterium]|nr:hypothetical protein [Pseudomonadota bacterium]MCP4916366.1 hypothetical protein [Pseudomonadota bacterium]